VGQDIQFSSFSEADFAAFRSNLRLETARLAQWIKGGVFERDQDCSIGLELEAWLLDKDCMPSPHNQEFLSTFNHPLVVPELSKYNFELNASPRALGGDCFSVMQDELELLWRKAQSHAGGMDLSALMIGSCPTLRDDMMTVDNLSDNERYHALNHQVLRLRKNQPLKLDIEGRDHLQSVHQDIMLEAATTSFQIHLKIPFSQMVAFYNMSMVASASLVAASANSPFLFGCDLWDETRIPIFEQSVSLLAFPLAGGRWENRVTFGTGYVRDSMIEPFLENLDGHPVLLPVLQDKSPEWLSHLRLHNGNIWRWVRPIIGMSREGQPHMRIEQRVPPAGPTTADMIANMAFYVGLVHGLVATGRSAGEFVQFEDARADFYAAAKFGLGAEVSWDGRSGVNLQTLTLETLIPLARSGLEMLKIDRDDIVFFIDQVFAPRVQTGRTGAAWQRSWIAANGRDFQGLTAHYHHLQEKGLPVHEWLV